MNKQQIPEDIMSKIEQEAKDYGRKVAPLRFTDTNEDYLADVARQDYIAGRTASVQPLIDALQKISDRKRSLVLPFDAYKDKDEARKMCVALNDIDELATEALSSFPSSPNNTGEWIDVNERLPERTEPLLVYNDEINEQEVLIENHYAIVLAYNPMLEIYKAKYDGKWSEISSISVNTTDETIPTRWRSLPEPPKQ